MRDTRKFHDMNRRRRLADLSGKFKRRDFLRSAAVGLGALGLGSLFPTDAISGGDSGNQLASCGGEVSTISSFSPRLNV